MPFEHPDIRRVGVRNAAEVIAAGGREPPDSPDEAGQAQHRSGDRRPDDQLVPQLTVRADRREVDPVKHCADKSQPPGPSRRHQNRFARLLGHVEIGASVVCERDLVRRQQPAQLQRPLIGLGDPRRHLHRRRAVWRELSGDGQRGIAGRVRVPVAAVREHGRPHRAGLEPIDRSIAEHADTKPLRRLRQRRGHGRRIDARAIEVEHRRAAQALFCREPGHARVHHRDAGNEPHGKQHCAHNTQPAMRVDQRGNHARLHRATLPSLSRDIRPAIRPRKSLTVAPSRPASRHNDAHAARSPARHPPRDSTAPTRPGICWCGHRDAGARDRRQHGHLQRGQRSPAASTAVSRTRAPALHRRRVLDGPEGQSAFQLSYAEFSDIAATHRVVRAGGAMDHRVGA